MRNDKPNRPIDRGGRLSRKELRRKRRRVRRICAAIIVVSLLLAVFVHKGLLAIAAFVGAWQIFCGLRETFREIRTPAVAPTLEMNPPLESHGTNS